MSVFGGTRPIPATTRGSWLSRWFRPRYTSHTISGIAVRGTPEFVCRTDVALALLGQCGVLEVIQANLAAIRQAKRSGVSASQRRPVFYVGEPTWRGSVLWYAGAIAHDAHHVVLYRRAQSQRWFGLVRLSDWCGKEAERQCLAFQIDVLRRLQAPGSVLTYLQELMVDPTYQGNPRSWLDYWRRDW